MISIMIQKYKYFYYTLLSPTWSVVMVIHFSVSLAIKYSKDNSSLALLSCPPIPISPLDSDIYKAISEGSISIFSIEYMY